MISFVVPAHNEEQHIGPTLEAIQVAARGMNEPYEIVVADDASTDRTSAIASEFGARVVAVSYQQIAATRNAGARAARGDLLFFVDADTLVNSEVVARALRALRAGAVGGGAGVRYDEPVPRYFRALVRLTVAVSRAMRLSFGCFVFCTRAAFEGVGGFDETRFAGEEITFSRALKRRGKFVILREMVTTSGRKLRAHSGREYWSSLANAVLHMLGIVRDRRGLEAWYGKRRPDPGSRA